MAVKKPTQGYVPAGTKTGALESVLGRAIIEPSFRKLLFKNPAKIKKMYNLTAKEMRALKKIKPAHLETFADTLKAKLLKSASETIFCATRKRE